MRYQIAEMQIVKSDFYRNLNTTEIAKNSTAICPHTHVLQVIKSKLVYFSAMLADDKLTIADVEKQFYSSVLIQVASDR